MSNPRRAAGRQRPGASISPCPYSHYSPSLSSRSITQDHTLPALPMPPTTHTSDPLLQPFLAPSYSPVTYLNSTLPSLPPPTSKPSLAALTSQTQSQISALSAQTARLSTALTALTDDILRCSSRLAYEVELLRGEAGSLVEALEDEESELGAAIRKFVPPPPSSTAAEKDQNAADPTTETLHSLKTLLHVKARLQQTTQIFNSALNFPLPPSLFASTASSLISINPPENADAGAEERGQAALSNLRREIGGLLALDNTSRGPGSRDEEEGIKKARERIAELRETVSVWKGTGEEKARAKVVDGLEAMVDEAAEKRRKRDTAMGASGRGQGGASRPVMAVQEEGRSASASAGGGKGGFLGGLQRLREEIYMD